MTIESTKDTGIKRYYGSFQITLEAEKWIYAPDRESAQEQIEDMSYEEIISCVKANKLTIVNIQEVEE